MNMELPPKQRLEEEGRQPMQQDQPPPAASPTYLHREDHSTPRKAHSSSPCQHMAMLRPLCYSYRQRKTFAKRKRKVMHASVTDRLHISPNDSIIHSPPLRGIQVGEQSPGCWEKEIQSSPWTGALTGYPSPGGQTTTHRQEDITRGT